MNIATESHANNAFSHHSLQAAAFSALAVAICAMAVHGKVSSCQLVLLTVVAPLFYAINDAVLGKYLNVTDMTGGLRVCTFGAFFGLGLSLLSWRYTQQSKRHRLHSSASNQFYVLIAIVAFFHLWPSLFATALIGDKKHRALLNCYLSMFGAAITSFALSSLLDERNRISVVSPAVCMRRG